MQTSQAIFLDNYELSMSEMTLEDVPQLHELSIGVNWPHRAHDWALLIGLGEGFVARDSIGRVLGSAMWLPIGTELASIGMVITSPRLQDQGAGRWLMHHVLERIGTRGKILNATKAAYRLYLSLDFLPVKTVYQHNGFVTSLPDGPDYARTMEPKDIPAILELDEIAQGGSRKALLERLFPQSYGTIVKRDGLITGFALRRNFGRGQVIGPVVAQTEEDCLALIRPHVHALQGQFGRMDTRADDGALRQYLLEAGFRLHDTVITMTLGKMPATNHQIIFGLASQALG